MEDNQTSELPEETPKDDWLFESFLYAEALYYLLGENEGIVVSFPGEGDEEYQAVVARRNGRIEIESLEQDLPDGTKIWLGNTLGSQQSLN